MPAILDEILYPRAPIVEAVIELRFANVSAQKVAKAAHSIRSRYADQSEESLVEGSMDFVSRTATFKDVTTKIKLTSRDQTDAAHFSIENAVWVRLAPYEGWAQLFERVQIELPKVLKALGFPMITRIGLRYVNRIDVPVKDGVGFPEDYLSYRIVSNDLLDPQNGFKWSLKKDFAERNMSALVQSATVGGEIPNVGGVIFDIDVSVSVDVPSKSPDILNRLCEMRQLKNEIFEGGITDKARELFNEPRD